jgi:hypothetical protein
VAATYSLVLSEDAGIKQGRFLDELEFIEEGPRQSRSVSGEELDGRLLTDLSKIQGSDLTTPNDRFYIRTRASLLLPTGKPSSILVAGSGKSIEVSTKSLRSEAEPMGLHVLECSGNSRSVRFGLISAAEWHGVPLVKLLGRAGVDNLSANVLVSGFDSYSRDSVRSIPGAEWIFSMRALERSKAFLATHMNGVSLLRDHGFPCRLIVPGWYGCCCIKWVDKILAVDTTALPTSQMIEYASRTHQHGVPKLARDYEAATIDTAALPIRVERWLIRQRVMIRVVGISWGGKQPPNGLVIKFGTGTAHMPVEQVYPVLKPGGWTVWTHSWKPIQAGRYVIYLRLTNAEERARRLNAGYYDRTIELKNHELQ